MANSQHGEPSSSSQTSDVAKMQEVSLTPIYRVTVMSWCFQFLLDLLWIPLAAYFKDLGWGLHVLGAVFAVNLGVRVIPNVLATRIGVKSDVFCVCCGLACFSVNLIWPTASWAIFVMSAGGGMCFVRAHLSVHGKIASGGSKEHLTLASKWCGAARNAGTVVAFAVPVFLYDTFGWCSVIIFAMCAMVLYLILATVQHASAVPASGADEALSEGLVEEGPAESIPWIDWVMAGAFCMTELQMNVFAAAVPTVMMRTFGLRVSLVGAVQAVGQVVAMSFLVLLSRGFVSILQKRPLNLVLSFSGTFVAISFLWMGVVFQMNQVAFVIVFLYMYYMTVYTAQVTLLECLLGVLDMQSSIFVMGVAEMFGCGFSLIGGYLGPALLEVDMSAPFALQMALALMTTAVLALTLGHRAMSQMVVCETEDQYDADMHEMIQRRPSLRKSLSGLKRMKERPDSYIGVEQRFRKHNRENSGLPPISSSGSLCPVSSSQSLCNDELCPVGSSQSLWNEEQGKGEGATPAAKDGNDLEQALLQQPSPSRKCSPHQRCTSEVVPIPDAAASTYEARQFKKAMVNWDLAGFDIDTKDYSVETSAVKKLVITHRRVRSSM